MCVCYRSLTSTAATTANINSNNNNNNNNVKKKYLHKYSDMNTQKETNTHICLFICSPAYLDTVTFTDNYAKSNNTNRKMYYKQVLL